MITILKHRRVCRLSLGGGGSHGEPVKQFSRSDVLELAGRAERCTPRQEALKNVEASELLKQLEPGEAMTYF